MPRVRRTPRLVSLAALLIALAGAVWAGTAVRHHIDGPDPIPTVRAATVAYASGDCAELKALSAEPAATTCDDVAQISKAYRTERLDPDSFTYQLASRDSDVANVRISYERAGEPAIETVRLEKQGDDWKITPTPNGLG